MMTQTVTTSIDDLPDFCSITDVSALFGISRATAYRMAAQGSIPSIKIGRRVILSREHLKRWVDAAMDMGVQSNGTA